MYRKLLVATRNPGKVVEFSEMLTALDVDWLSLDDVGSNLEVEETGTTFLANAILKAEAYAKSTGLMTIADDSGLEVDALEGAPGIYTARYGGQRLSSIERYEYLLTKLVKVPDENRTARFRCVIALAGTNGDIYGSASGTCEGLIASEPMGHAGFGYDPVFYLPELKKTMAQLTASKKHAISHRGRALRAIEPLLQKVLA